MKKIYSLLASVALMSAFTACSSDDEMPSQMANVNGSELIVKSVGVASIDTKAGIMADKFTNSETLGLYIYKGAGINNGEIASGDEQYNNADGLVSTVNVPYQTNVGGTSWTAAQPIILSNVKGKVYAYYPYAENNKLTGTGADNGLAVKVSVLTEQGTGQSNGSKDDVQTDYMWAVPKSDVSNAAPSVDLTMNHALTMITFKFKQTETQGELYPGAGKVSQIVLKNQTGGHVVKVGDATMNIATGKINLGSTAVDGSIELIPNSTETLMGVETAEKLPRLLVYPTTADITGNDAEVTVTVDGNSYTVKIPALKIDDPNSEDPQDKLDSPWLAGKNYTYTLTLKGTGLEITSVGINAWQDESGNEGEDMPVQTPDGPVSPEP